VSEERLPVSPSTLDRSATLVARQTLAGFIRRLIAGYRRLRDGSGVAGNDASILDDSLHSLLLAEAAIRYSDWTRDDSRRPPQVAVLGPTQTGKSTVVNLLLGQSAAPVSPLAGFTVHPQAFCWVTPASMPGLGPNEAGGSGRWASELFPGWQRREPGQLGRQDFEAYALTAVEAPTPGLQAGCESEPARAANGARPVMGGPGRPITGAALTAPPGDELPPCVLWDTPDFDSLSAHQYARGVLEVAALADLYLLALSEEKYSDLSVWRLLELIEPLGRPLVICLNKLIPGGEPAVVRSLGQRLAERGRGWGQVPVVTLPYDARLATGDMRAALPLAPRLRSAVRDALTAGTGCPSRGAGVCSLLRRRWDAWLTPVHAEHQALAEWAAMVRLAATRFMESYTRDYLEHPQRYDAFRRATLELLNLLEIPKVAGLMGRARQLVTWPLRQVVAAGRAWWSDRLRPAHALHSLGAEPTVLVDTLDALLTGLQRDVLRRCGPARSGWGVWQALERSLEAEQGRLRELFEAAIRAHHQQMGGEISAAANRLYAELQKHPARLTALRTARATLDLGYVLLAVKTAGLSLLDAVWAPAAFATTSLLMEALAGLEMAREAQRLKARQRAAVEKEFVEATLVRELNGLAGGLDQAGLLAITPEQLRAATRALETWERSCSPEGRP
jgi:hypothetical protein